ncbi:unnamed protein product [Arctogadus glacialis]
MSEQWFCSASLSPSEFPIRCTLLFLQSAEKPSGDDSAQSVQREPTAAPADGSQCPDCQRRQQSADIQYGAKIPNRYTVRVCSVR